MLVHVPDAQRCHWYAKLIGVVPLHTPLEAVNVPPTAGVPEMSGAVVFAGAVAPPPEPAGLTRWDAEFADVEPVESVAVTVTMTFFPTSPSTSVYVWLVAPEIALQPLVATEWFVEIWDALKAPDVSDELPKTATSSSVPLK